MTPIGNCYSQTFTTVAVPLNARNDSGVIYLENPLDETRFLAQDKIRHKHTEHTGTGHVVCTRPQRSTVRVKRIFVPKKLPPLTRSRQWA